MSYTPKGYEIGYSSQGCSHIPQADWAAGSTWVVLFAAAVLLGAFVAMKARLKDPLMPLARRCCR
ncbi:hypothetical protein ACFXG4_28260 [Nocardia sp. NPDC059246]|uniref:hypothetical protein n=1 Tax=unclassified Nocardia TaxID=2637762 RepID=UPI0036924604